MFPDIQERTVKISRKSVQLKSIDFKPTNKQTNTQANPQTNKHTLIFIYEWVIF